jgi:GT2 family glycosyltransferase
MAVYNQLELTRRCLGSLLENSRIAREIVIVDNHSTDETPKYLLEITSLARTLGWNIQVITHLENRGFGRAINQGMNLAQGEYVAILNNDTWLMPGWDEALLSRAHELQADMVSPYYDENPFDSKTTPIRAQKFTRRNAGRYSREWGSVLMFFRKESYEKVGRMDERFFLTCEDTDLRERMDRSGMRYFKVADCFIWHRSKGTRGTQAMPRDYETQALNQFIEKWGFDPRLRENTRVARIRRRLQKIRNAIGLF